MQENLQSWTLVPRKFEHETQSKNRMPNHVEHAVVQEIMPFGVVFKCSYAMVAFLRVDKTGCAILHEHGPPSR
jgi:hypothetical protein